MSDKINNGRQGRIAFGEPPIERIAGIVVHDGQTQAAFFGDVAQLRGVTTAVLDGVECTIVKTEKGDMLNGRTTVRLTLQPIDAEPAPQE